MSIKLIIAYFILGVLTFYAVDWYVNGTQEPANKESTRSSAMSPCECKVAGGCGVQWSPLRLEYSYSDGTYPNDYDKWGRYSGGLNVPEICRRALK